MPDSKERLIESAIDLFSKKWYGIVSVAEICRDAGLSNGLFYRYFDSKEEIFKQILESVNKDIERNLSSINASGSNIHERLSEFTRLIYEFSQFNTARVKVFREGQYRFFEYERRLKAVYEKALSKVLGRPNTLSEYLFSLGGLRFASIRAALHGIPVKMDSLVSILEKGMFGEFEFDPDKVFSTSIRPLTIELIPDAREKILKESKALLGAKGYFETNIHDITSAAGFAVGTFYTYFPSKDSFYAELVKQVGKEVRQFISINIDPSLNRLERELRGIWLFIVYLSLDRNCYGIVREAESILPESAKEYYEAFVRGYKKNSEGSGPYDLDTTIEFLQGVAHYLGLEVVFDESPENAKSIITEIGEFYRKGFGI
jgi:AcrR family transcriptional regulator